MFQARPHLHHAIISYFKNKELDDLYISVFLKSLGESFITIFVPVYLFILGYGIREIAIYYLIHYVVMAIVMPFFMKLCAKIGVKKVMAIGSVLLLISYFLLNQVSLGLTYIVPAFFTSLSSGAYYGAFHIDFAKSAVNKKEAKEISMLKIIAIITASLGPLIGSFIIAKNSFSGVFIVASILILISIIPLFLTKDFKIKDEKLSLKKILKADSSSKAMAYRADAATSAINSNFWPLFIFITLGSFVSLGTIFSFTSIIMIFLISYIGKLADKNARKTFKIGVFSQTPLWIIKLFLITPIGFFISNFLNGISKDMTEISFHKVVYRSAEKRKDLISYFTFRQINHVIGRVIILGVVIAITFFITNQFHLFIIIFMTAGILSLLFLVLLRDKSIAF